MATSRATGIGLNLHPQRCCRPYISPLSNARQTALRRQTLSVRHFQASARKCENQQQHRKESFGSRLRSALRNTKITWYPIPVGLGIGLLGVLQFLKIQKREAAEQERLEREREDAEIGNGERGPGGRPKKRPRARPSGPWQVQVMSTLPLKGISRLWGKFNELNIPYYLRVPGFKLYSFIFGVNLSEIAEPDLHNFPNLASFFYRTLKPGLRPLDPNHDALLSPADGKVIQFGTVEGGEVEQVKGVTYSLDGLLGRSAPSTPTTPTGAIPATTPSSSASDGAVAKPAKAKNNDETPDVVASDEEFARLNGISYTIPNLFSGPQDADSKQAPVAPSNQSTVPSGSSISAVHADFANSAADQAAKRPWWAPQQQTPEETATPTTLYYMVVYLAPGDYHRFHSPVSWVVSSRRHFAGELYSVSPYLQRTLPGLFTLNERVVLLGRWRWGFFSYTPVGATNVGSIVVNFDRELRTNSLTTDTAADRAAEEAKERGEAYSGFAEASYEESSRVLGGHPVVRGEEMGGFQLGSTIVMVFEAPKGRRKDGLDDGFSGKRLGGWKWNVKKGDKVKVGQALGQVIEDGETGS